MSRHNMFRGAIGTVLVLAVMTLMQSASHAQSTGNVTGTVYDQAGAVVPKATVLLINDATKDTRKTTSNDAGYFSFPSMQPGEYTVKISASGFKSWQQSGVPVRPGDVRDVAGISLQVGGQDETIKVESVAEEVAPVDSGERSSVLTSKQIENLSLEGRDATELIRTLPGFNNFQGGSVNNQGQDFTVISPTGGAVGQGSSGNGSPYRGGTDLISDGAHIIDNGCNCGATATVNGDMVSEVKVQTSNFGADSAKGPIVVNAIGKSGSTAYHGEAYTHIRDQSLNSLDWSFNRLQQTSPSGTVPSPLGRFLYPGVSFGGPVPHTNKKLVFWTGYEYYYQHGFPMPGLSTLGLLTDTVPTLSMRKGIFDLNPAVAPDNQALCGGSGIQGYQPTCANMFDSSKTGGGFNWADGNGGGTSNTNIPTTAFDPGGQILVNQIPLPNADPTKTGGYNLLVPENLNQNGWMFRSRADYNISDNSKLYVTYQIQKETDNQPVHLWWEPFNSIPFPNGMSSKDNSQTLSGHFLHVFNSTLTNDVATGLGYINYPLVENNKNSWGIAANNYPYQGLYHNKYNMMPQISDGYWLAGVPQMIQPDIFAAGGGTFVWKKWNYSVEDNLTKVYKTHTIKTGFYWEKTVNNQGAFSDYNGNLQATSGGPFNSCDGGPSIQGCTGNTNQIGSNNPVANLLLGVGPFDQVTKYALDNLWYPTYSAFVQDDWKVTKRLTVNLGLRGDHLGAWRSPNSQGVATFTGDASSQQPLFSWHGINPSIPLTGRNVPTITWEPRLGLAYDLRGNGKTVLRGGWGEYGYRDQYNDAGGAADLAQGALTFTTPQAVSLAYVNALGNAGGPSASFGTGSGLLLTDHNQPITRSYNFTISQQLPGSSLLEIGYVGSQSLYGDLQGNSGALDTKGINTMPIGAAFMAYGSAAGACTTPLAAVNQAANNPGNKGPCDPSSNGVPIAAFPLSAVGYSNADVAVVRHVVKSDYNALQTSWVRQKGRLTYNLNYTWSKTLGTQGTAQFGGLPPDSTNLAHDFGISSIDRTHVFNFSYVFQTGNPIKGNKLLGAVGNGWSVSGITTWQSGPYLPGLTNTNLGLGGTGPAYTYNNGASVSNYAVNNLDFLGTPNQQLQPTVLCNPTAHLKAHQYFNADCFGVPAAGSQGWYQLPYIHGPAYFNSDLAIFKTFKLTERQAVEFRASGFNFLNHPLDSFQNSGGDDTIGFTYTCNGQSAQNNAACTYGAGSFVPNAPSKPYSLFGQPGTTAYSSGFASTRFGRRVIEFSLKYSF